MNKLPMRLMAMILVFGFAGTLSRAEAQSAAASDKTAVEALVKKYADAFVARDVNAVMSCYAPGKGVFVFDAVPPREYASWDAYKKDWKGLFAAYPGPVSMAVSELSVTVAGSVAYGHDVQSGFFTRKDGSKLYATVRATDVFRKINGKWLIVQEHVSFPVDIETGKADLQSKP